jgi:hypothetical protein
MTRSIAFARALGGATLAGALLLALPASAQTTPDCSTLTNPVYFTGSSAFDPTVGSFAVKLAALGAPITLVYNPTNSCGGVASISGNSDLTGNAHSYAVDPTSGFVNAACTLPAGIKADIAVSDVFWESCTSAPAMPSTITDYKGPVQAMEFVVPETSTAMDISFEEAQLVYGCGAAGSVSPFLSDAGIFYRDSGSGSQIIIAKSIGLSPASLRGTATTGSGNMLSSVTGFATPTAAIGFLAADFYDKNRTMLNALAFRAKEQTKAYNADSNAGVTDKKNVRDGHYIPWGYEHLLAMPTNTKALNVIGYLTGTKTDASFDYVERTAFAKTIPLCAMKVQRTTDGGDLSYSTRTDTCDCAYEAFATSSTPTGCATCDATHPCTGSLSCKHGFCE